MCIYVCVSVSNGVCVMVCVRVRACEWMDVYKCVCDVGVCDLACIMISNKGSAQCK